MAFARKTRELKARLAAGEEVRLELRWAAKPTEFEIQAYVYRHLREMGYMARGEVRCKGSGAARVDLAVFGGSGKQRRLLLIVEIKRPDVLPRKARWQVREQLALYRRFGVPVCLVCGLDAAKRFLAEVRAGGLPVADWGLESLGKLRV
jgi:hypothetical protein